MIGQLDAFLLTCSYIILPLDGSQESDLVKIKRGLMRKPKCIIFFVLKPNLSIIIIAFA